MQSNDLIVEIGCVLSSSDSVQALAALRQDPLVWESLEQADFQKLAFERAGSQVRCWSPGQLALLALDEPRSADTFQAEPMVTLGQVLQERVLQAYQATQRSAKAPTTLREAALLALALRERRRLTGTWSGLLQELMPKTSKDEIALAGSAGSTLLNLWRTPLACLYSLVPDPEEMLRSLLVRCTNRASYDWIVAAVLSQPLAETEQVMVFAQVLKGSAAAAQLNLLRSLSLHGGERAAAALSSALLVNQPAFSNLRAQLNTMPADLVSLSNRALALQHMGAFYLVSGERSEALALYDAAEETLKHWLSGLYLQRMNVQMGMEAAGTGVLMQSDQISHLAGASHRLEDALGVVLMSHPYASSLLDQMPEDTQSAFLQLKQARQIFDNQPALARDLARKGCASLVTNFRGQGAPFFGDFVFVWQPADSLNILIEMDLLDEALDLAQVLLEMRPADVYILHLQGEICERLGKMDQAIIAAQHVAILDPKNPAWQRRVGVLWAQLGDWEQAYQARENVLSLIASPSVEDRIACAQAALPAGHVERTITLGEALLQEDANNGISLGLLGQALEAKGDYQQAINYLVRATLLSPEALQPWLALAHVQQALEEPLRALETLRSAVTAVPEAAEGHLALGEACVSSGLLAEALPHLKKAFHLLPDSAACALTYGRTLRELGHASEARGILEQVHSSWTTNPELAYMYAQVLLDLDNAEDALPVLETALQNGLPVLEGYLLYAKILLGEYGTYDDHRESGVPNARMQQADQALHHILEIDPHNLEARFLMADILRERGDFDEALIAYRALADSPDSGGTELRWRVQYGLGRTALRLDQVGTALVALKEACQAKPDHLPLLRALAEASLQADLPKEAVEAATDALHLSPDDVEMLSWYAEFVTRAGESRLAVEALESAVQLEPDRADLRVNLAVSQLESGNPSGARATLASIEGLEHADRDGLRHAAQVYLRIEDPQAALVCFERAITVESPVPSDLLFEVAQLQARLNNHEAALELAQQALEDTPENLPVHLLQSDLLVHLNRPQAALAVLEHALRVAQNSQYPLDHEDRPAMKQFLGEIHERFTALMLQAHDLPAALHHAERALSINPNRIALCYQAADLALAQLQFDRAARTLVSYPAGAPDEAKALLSSGADGANLLGLKIEMALDNRQESEAGAWIKELQEQAASPRLLAALARVQARQNDLPAARQVFENAWKQAGSQATLWMAEAALEVERWKDALTMAESYAQDHLYEARAQLSFARILVLCAEKQRLCGALGCQTNAPGAVMLSETNRQKFEDAIHDTLKLVNAGEVGRWQARGQAVFAPSAQTARVLASMPALPDDTAALMSVLCQLNNRAAAIQIARRHAGHPLVMLHQAMSSLGEASPENKEVAEKAVVANPNQPLAHVILAKILQEACELPEALHAYENALSIWPDEPAWHDAAGDLCMQVNALPSGIQHRRQALALDPKNPVYAYKLGQACLVDEEYPTAIGYLEQSTLLDPDQADVWLMLATAYQMVNRLPQAMEASRKASELNPASAQGLLIAGETALSMNDTDLALEYAQSAVRREPESAAAVLFLSNVLVQRGRVEEGLDVIESASAAVKAVFPVAFERGKLIHRLHGPKAALDILEKLEKDNSEEPDLLGYLARAHAECGNAKDAERFAFKALRLDPDQADLNLMLGRLQRETGQLDQAVYLLSEAVRMAPDNLESFLELGSVYQQRREFLQALQVYQQAMHVAPGDYQAYYQSGLIMRDSKDYPGAEAMLRRAAELAPDNLSIRRQLVGVIAMNLVHHTQEAPVP